LEKLKEVTPTKVVENQQKRKKSSYVRMHRARKVYYEKDGRGGGARGTCSWEISCLRVHGRAEERRTLIRRRRKKLKGRKQASEEAGK